MSEFEVNSAPLYPSLMDEKIIEVVISSITVALGLGVAHVLYRSRLKRRANQEQIRRTMADAPDELKLDIQAYRERRRRELGLKE